MGTLRLWKLLSTGSAVGHTRNVRKWPGPCTGLDHWHCLQKSGALLKLPRVLCALELGPWVLQPLGWVLFLYLFSQKFSSELPGLWAPGLWCNGFQVWEILCLFSWENQLFSEALIFFLITLSEIATNMRPKKKKCSSREKGKVLICNISSECQSCLVSSGS